MSANIDQNDDVKITPKMYEAGKKILVESGILPFTGELGCEGAIAAEIYRAMRRASEKP